MIPLRDNIPTRRFPVVSAGLILLNVAVFLLDQATGRAEIIQVVSPDGTLLGVRHGFEGGLSAQYAMIPAAVTGNLAAAWPTVFASMFLHANWLHIGGNMLSLWIFGNNVEDTLGRGRFLLFYLLCGLAAAGAQVMSDPHSSVPTVGASGAIAGVMGGYLILFPQAQVLSIVPLFVFSTIMEVPAILVIGLWAVVQFLNANWLGGGGQLHGGGVAYFAHIGGLVAGIVIVSMLGGRRLADRRDERHLEEYYR